ncbi:hypothetical protein NL676_011822 [Syzygium grande]|nr:hypothetical protein NL676_011822 [Syzygium grande]
MPSFVFCVDEVRIRTGGTTGFLSGPLGYPKGRGPWIVGGTASRPLTPDRKCSAFRSCFPLSLTFPRAPFLGPEKGGNAKISERI